MYGEPYKDEKRENEFVRWEFESPFVSLIEKFGVEDVPGWMKRKLTGGRCADVVFAEDKPFFLRYSRGKLTMSYHYQVVNNCGVVL